MKNKLLDKFLVLEDKNNLFEAKIEGMQFWSIIRFRVYTLIYQQKNNTQINHPKRKIIQSVLLILKSLFISFKKSPFFLKKKNTIVFNHSRKIMNTNGDYECKYTEHLTDNDSYVFEIPFQDKHLTPFKTANLIYLDVVLNISRFFSLYSYFRKISKRDNEKLIKLHDSLKEEFEIEIPNFNRFVLLCIYKHKTIMFLAKIILKRIKPSKIFVAQLPDSVRLSFQNPSTNGELKVVRRTNPGHREELLRRRELMTFST